MSQLFKARSMSELKKLMKSEGLTIYRKIKIGKNLLIASSFKKMKHANCLFFVSDKNNETLPDISEYSNLYSGSFIKLANSDRAHLGKFIYVIFHDENYKSCFVQLDVDEEKVNILDKFNISGEQTVWGFDVNSNGKRLVQVVSHNTSQLIIYDWPGSNSKITMYAIDVNILMNASLECRNKKLYVKATDIDDLLHTYELKSDEKNLEYIGSKKI